MSKVLLAGISIIVMHAFKLAPVLATAQGHRALLSLIFEVNHKSIYVDFSGPRDPTRL